jgi:hypothetical protein
VEPDTAIAPRMRPALTPEPLPAMPMGAATLPMAIATTSTDDTGAFWSAISHRDLAHG